jgi:hypothetical protein
MAKQHRPGGWILVVPLSVLLVALSVTAAPGTAHAISSSKVSGSPVAAAVDIDVSGSPLTGITSSPLAMSPRFTTADTDYVWYCAAGSNQLSIDLSSSGTISVGSQTGSILSVPVTVADNQAVVVNAPSGTQYWIRCLPSTFPQLTVKKPGGGGPDYYLTESFKNSKSPGYPIILNSYGTPVWYLNGVPGSSQNTQLIPGTHTIAWDQDPFYALYNLDTMTESQIEAPVAPFDEHELYYDTSGNAWMLSRPSVSGYDLSDVGYPSIHKIADCVVQEVNPQGQLIWEWKASQHVSPDETDSLVGVIQSHGVKEVDVYHCNSIDVDPLNQDDVLVSMRAVGVFLIDKTTGDILWKLGGTSVAPEDGEPVLHITDDPEQTIIGQHDARFQPDGSITMFDDHTRTKGAARGVEYAINTSADSATMTWEYAAPSGDNSQFMGSIRMYDSNTQPYDQAGADYLGDQEVVVNWGGGVPNAGFTVVNANNKVLMRVEYPSGYDSYRTSMVPISALDLTELRNSAGTTVP